MNEFITAADIVSTIMLLRDSFGGAIVLLEGGGDSLLYEKFINKERCRTSICHGRENVVEALKIVNAATLGGVLGIIDADFSQLAPELADQVDAPNLFTTDFHDLETMMLVSPALEQVLRERGQAEKIRRFIESSAITIRDALIRAATPVAYLRLVSITDKFHLKFRGLDFSRFLDVRTLSVDQDALITTVKRFSNRLDIPNTTLAAKISELSKTEYDPWQLCNGHDMVCILSIGLHKALGTHEPKLVSPEITESNLRMSYDFTYFITTSLFHKIRQWETDSGYQVLRRVPMSPNPFQMTALSSAGN